MSYIGHRCSCGHLPHHHERDVAGKRHCIAAAGGRSCGKGCRPSKKATVIHTVDGRGRRIEAITAPGERIAKGALGIACTCEACTALYEQLADA